jgi:foldase protein PrsA
VKLIYTLCAMVLAFTLLTGAALAADSTPVASKDGTSFTLEDLNIYWLRNLGKDGLLDFFQTMVVYQEGLKQNLKPTDQEVSDFINKTMGQDIYTQFKQLYSERAVHQLVEYTLVTAKYETWMRDKLRKEKNITVTEQEANQYFLEHIDQFHKPEGVWISIISVDNQTQADAVIARLDKGENFNDVAGEVNMDANMRAVRGEIGMYRKGDGLPDPLEKAAFALAEGQHSAVIKGQNFHIVFCHKHYPEVAPAFADVKEYLMQDMVEQKIDPFYIDTLNALMERELPRFNIQASLFRPDEEPKVAAPAAAQAKPAPAK